MTLDYLDILPAKIDKEALLKISEEKLKQLQFKGNERFKTALDFSTTLTLEERAKLLMPWKKGPFQVEDLYIDSEWRSDFKWKRMAPFALSAIDDDKSCVLDIGANNGHALFEMSNIERPPKLLLGIDPVLRVHAQFQFLQHYYKRANVHHELWGVEHLSFFPQCFDLILHMGIIYHHRHPLAQLQDIKNALRPGGTCIIETICINDNKSYALFPEDRYAQMKNVYFIPTPSCLENWLKRCKFKEIEMIQLHQMTEAEQRSTPWSPHPSYKDFLDPNDPNKTIEGHMAPWRVSFKAKI